MYSWGVKQYRAITAMVIIILILGHQAQARQSETKIYQVADLSAPLIGYLKTSTNICNLGKGWGYVDGSGFININTNKSYQDCLMMEPRMDNLSIYNNIAIDNDSYYLCQDQINQNTWWSLVSTLKYQGQIKCYQQSGNNQNNQTNNGETNKTAIQNTLATTVEPQEPINTPSQKQLNASLWAQAQVGQKYRSNGKNWDGWCDLFVASAYGRSYSGHNTAYDHYKYLSTKKWINSSKDVPIGALAFFGPTKGNSAGHVIISIGQGHFVSSGKVVHITTLNMSGVGQYLGWAYDQDW